jgi:hypothetical protein
MGLGIYLAAKDEFGEVGYIEPDEKLEAPKYLSRWLCWAYCDYDELGKECILYRSIKAMGLDPELLFLMEYFRYGELSYLEFLMSEAETDEAKAVIKADYEKKMDASWQPIESVTALLTDINSYISIHDISRHIYVNDNYKEYFAKKEVNNKSLFEEDMLYLMYALRSAHKEGLGLVSFDMG